MHQSAGESHFTVITYRAFMLRFGYWAGSMKYGFLWLVLLTFALGATIILYVDPSVFAAYVATPIVVFNLTHQ